jgi:hypothetical protein
MNGVVANQKTAIALVTGLKSLKQITLTVKRETKEVKLLGILTTIIFSNGLTPMKH